VAAISEVVASNAAGFAPGDLVFADTGWQDPRRAAGQAADEAERREPAVALLSVYGIAGLTAYFGLLQVGRPKAGDTVVVSAAAGSVGSLCRSDRQDPGLPSGRHCRRRRQVRLAADRTGLRRGGRLQGRQPQRAALKAAAPAGIDVYFDNVGGDILEACLFRMNLGGRMACCGAVSQYDGAPPRPRPARRAGPDRHQAADDAGLHAVRLRRRASTQALGVLEGWVRAGRLKVPEDIIDGLENTPGALIGLLAGENVGKRMVRVG
jgi:NADPH-dependent curcumin reductase CurA